MEFFRQEYWSGLPFPSPGDLSNPGIYLRSPALQVFFTIWATREAPKISLDSLFMLHQLHCSKSCRILKDLLKSHLKLLIPVVVHLKTAYQLRLFKDCMSSFPHNVFQFPRYIMPYLENRLFFFFLFYNLAYSILNLWNVFYTSSLMNFCVLFFPP